MWALFGLGIVRGLISLLAYPAARGADSLAYFFYAERLYGLDMPGLAQVVPPLYPILILVTYKWLSSAYLLIALQLLMSAAIIPLFYEAVKRVDSVLALLVSVVILLDFQLAVVFNFISTEPLYVFLLALSFNLFMRVAWRDSAGPRAMTAAAGISLVLLLLTRAVARFMILPLALVYLLQRRNWKQLALFVGGFGVSLLLWSLVSQSLLAQVEGVSSSTYMVTGIVRRNSEWLAPENGPATAVFIDLQETCAGQRLKFYTCYEYERGTTDGLIPLIINTTIETVRANIGPYTVEVWGNLNRFLKLSGQQLGFDPGTPSAAQCANPDGWVDALALEDTYGYGWNWAWGVRRYIDNNFETFRAYLRPIIKSLCPPLPDSAGVRQVVEYLTFRYRSLGRPNPMLWYGALFALTLIVPWVRRRYLTLVLAGSVYLFNHALISAVIDNVQPRYVVVTNPFRAILLVTLVYLVVGLLYQAWVWGWTKWRITESVVS